MRNQKPKIRVKIKSCKVVTDAEKSTDFVRNLTDFSAIKRPSILMGYTAKLKPPPEESHALYITMNYIEHQGRFIPYEIFLNSAHMESYQWIVIMTRLISAIWRKGGDNSFLIEECKSVFNPSGGYWRPGGKFMNSIVAEIGAEIEKFLIYLERINAGDPDEPDDRNIPIGNPGKIVLTSFLYEKCELCLMPSVARLNGKKICANCGNEITIGVSDENTR